MKYYRSRKSLDPPLKFEGNLLIKQTILLLGEI